MRAFVDISDVSPHGISRPSVKCCVLRYLYTKGLLYSKAKGSEFEHARTLRRAPRSWAPPAQSRSHCTTNNTRHTGTGYRRTSTIPRVLSRVYTSSPLTTPHGTSVLFTASPPLCGTMGGKATLVATVLARCSSGSTRTWNGNPGGSPTSACSPPPGASPTVMGAASAASEGAFSPGLCSADTGGVQGVSSRAGRGFAEAQRGEDTQRGRPRFCRVSPVGRRFLCDRGACPTAGHSCW